MYSMFKTLIHIEFNTYQNKTWPKVQGYHSLTSKEKQLSQAWAHNHKLKCFDLVNDKT